MDKPSNNLKKAIETCKLQSIEELRAFLPTDTIYTLIKHYGGCAVYFPKFEQLLKQERNDKIQDDYKSGLSIRAISRKYSLTERQIRSIIKT